MRYGPHSEPYALQQAPQGASDRSHGRESKSRLGDPVEKVSVEHQAPDGAKERFE